MNVKKLVVPCLTLSLLSCATMSDLLKPRQSELEAAEGPCPTVWRERMANSWLPSSEVNSYSYGDDVIKRAEAEARINRIKGCPVSPHPHNCSTVWQDRLQNDWLPPTGVGELNYGDDVIKRAEAEARINRINGCP